MASNQSENVVLGTGLPSGSIRMSPINPYAGDIAAIGDITSGVGGLLQGFEIQDAYSYNAGILNEQADNVMFASDLHVDEIGAAEEEMLGTQKTMYARAGVTMAGSPTDTALQTATNFEFDKQVATYNARVKAQNLESQASLDKFYGKEAANEGILKLGASLLKGAGALL